MFLSLVIVVEANLVVAMVVVLHITRPPTTTITTTPPLPPSSATPAKCPFTSNCICCFKVTANSGLRACGCGIRIDVTYHSAPLFPAPWSGRLVRAFAAVASLTTQWGAGRLVVGKVFQRSLSAHEFPRSIFARVFPLFAHDSPLSLFAHAFPLSHFAHAFPLCHAVTIGATTETCSTETETYITPLPVMVVAHVRGSIVVWGVRGTALGVAGHWQAD